MLAKRLEGVVGTIRHAHVLLQQNNRIDQRFRRTCASSTNDDSSISRYVGQFLTYICVSVAMIHQYYLIIQSDE